MRPTRQFRRPAARLRKIAAGLTLFLIVLSAIALALPGYIDWNRFKGEIEIQASAITGRRVFINGAVGFSLLPRPELFMENVTLANSEGATDPIMLSLERLEAHLDILPLFSGKIQVANFRIVAPVLMLEILPDGASNWIWQPGGAQDNSPDIRFDRVVIERGSLRYQNRATGSGLRLTEMDVQLNAVSFRGPFEAAGSLKLQEAPVNLNARIGAIQTGRATPIDVKTVLNGGTTINFSGIYSPDGTISGNLNSQGTDLTQLTAAMALTGIPVTSGVRPGFLRLPYKIESSLSAGPGIVTFDDIKMRLNDNMLTGRFMVDTHEKPTFEIIVGASSFDMDALPVPIAASANTSGAPNLPIDQFKIPHDLDGVVRINAKAVKLNGGYMRDVNAAVSISQGVAALDEMRGQLPGGTAAKLSGKVKMTGDLPHFAGRLDLSAQNLRGLLGWLGYALPKVPDRSLGRAEMTGLLELSPQRVELQEISAEVDSSKLTAGLALAWRDRPGLGIDLHVDQLNMDNYLPEEAGLAQNTQPTDNTKPDVGTPWTVARRLAGRFDSNFRLSIDRLIYRGVPVSGFEVDGALAGDTLAINSFAVADLAGSAISLSGIFSNFMTLPEGEINLRLASRDLGGLARTTGLTVPMPWAQLGNSSIEARFLLANDTVEAAIDSRFEDTRVQLNGALSEFSSRTSGPSGPAPALKAHISLANPSLTKFAAQTGLEITPEPAEEAAGVNLNADITATSDETSLSAVNGAIGTVPVQGKAEWRRTGARPMLQAEIHAGEIIAGNFSEVWKQSGGAAPPQDQRLPWSGAPFNFVALNQFDADLILDAGRISTGFYDFIKPALQINIREGMAELKQFTATLRGGEASANASLHYGGNTPELNAAWKLQGMNLEAPGGSLSDAPAMTGSVDFSGSIKGAGASSFAIVSNLEGKARLTARNGFIQGIDLPAFGDQLGRLERAADFSSLLDTVLKSGKTAYQRIDVPFVIRQGVAQSTEPQISIDSVTGGLDASIDLPRYWLNAESSLTLNAHMNAPPLGIAYIGPLNTPSLLLRTGRLENYFTQALLSKSLQRVISKSEPPAAPAAAPQTPPPPPAPPAQKDNSAKGFLNGILDGLSGGKGQ
ncbi:MAG: AsmA family protein [Alphaproteobacteria bacterium]